MRYRIQPGCLPPAAATMILNQASVRAGTRPWAAA